MPYGFSIWGEDSCLVLFNETYRALYRFGPDDVRVGMPLRELCDVTVALGNHPDVTAEQLFVAYEQQLRECTDPSRPIKAQKAIRGRIIKTTHAFSPGLGWIITHEDVTEETEQQWLAALTEKQLALQGRRFSAVIDNMSHGISIFDAEVRLVTCICYLEIYGLPAELGKTGTPVRAIVEHRHMMGAVPVDMDDFVEVASRPTGVAERYVETTRLRDGRVIQVTRSPVEGGGFIAIHQDISEKFCGWNCLPPAARRRPSRSCASRPRSTTCARASACSTRKSGSSSATKSYASIYGLPPELVRIGTAHADIVKHRTARGMHPVGGAESFLMQHWQLRKDEVSRVVVVELADGRLISIHHQPMADGGWVSTHQDVTEDHRRVPAIEASEQELKLQNVRFEAAINNMAHGLSMYDSRVAAGDLQPAIPRNVSPAAGVLRARDTLQGHH